MRFFQLKCCGVDSYIDWVSSFYGRVPRSCCIDDAHCSFKGTINQMKPYVHKIDCPKAIQEHFYANFFDYMLAGTVCTMIAFVSGGKSTVNLILSVAM
uniref:Uncharacterized protein n=1 Tax=Romanomermis culicivorax TaxID=13658 RepID=A0A915JKD9_ROMCU